MAQNRMVYTAEKALRDHEKEIPEEVKTEIQDKIKAVNEAKGKDDKAAIDTATTALSMSLSKIGEIMQKAAEEAQKGAETSNTTEEKKDGDEPTVHDAEEAK